MKWKNVLAALILGGLADTGAVYAQTFTIDWFSFDGSGTGSGGVYSMIGLIGPLNSDESSGGLFTLDPGFWSAGPGPETDKSGNFDVTGFIPDVNGAMALEAGSTAIAGCLVVNGGINVIGASNSFGLTPSKGGYLLDLSGSHDATAFGGLAFNTGNEFPTIVGQPYDVSFDLGSCLSLNGSVRPAVRVAVNDYIVGTFSADIIDNNHWQTFAFNFTATSTSTVITFTGVGKQNNGYIGLDNVVISPGETTGMPRAQIFVTQDGDSTIGQYATSRAAVNPALTATGLGLPYGIAAWGTCLFVANNNNTIGEYNLWGTTINAPLITGLNGPIGLAMAGTNLLVVNSGGNTIGEYTTAGALVNASLITGLNNPQFIAVSGANLFVVNNASGTIGEYTIEGLTVNASLIRGLKDPIGIAVSGESLFVVEAGNNRIGKYTTAGELVNANLVTGLNSPSAIAVADSTLFVVNTGSGTIGEYTTSGTTVNPSLISGLSRPYGIVLVTESNSIPSTLYGPYTSSGAGFGFNLGLVMNQHYLIQASTDLTTWVDLTNFVANSLTLPPVDATATNFTRRFYRVVSP